MVSFPLQPFLVTSTQYLPGVEIIIACELAVVFQIYVSKPEPASKVVVPP